MRALLSDRLERLTVDELSAAQAFAEKVQQHFKDQDIAILLFGSRARGDALPDSDMDILVVLPTPDLKAQQTIRHLAVEVWLKFGIYLSTRVWSEAHWQQHASLQTSFYRNLQHDAIELLVQTIRVQEPA